VIKIQLYTDEAIRRFTYSFSEFYLNGFFALMMMKNEANLKRFKG